MSEIIMNVIAPISGLLGVALGVMLSNRSQRLLAKDAERQAVGKEKRESCIEFLAAYRQLRRYVQTASMSVELVSHEDGSAATPVISDPGEHWMRIEIATARLHILFPSDEMRVAVTEVKRAFWDVLIARATYGSGEIPNNILVPAREAENHFADVARQSLGLDVELFADRVVPTVA